jgi:superfamily II DNA or RNA helicase
LLRDYQIQISNKAVDTLKSYGLVYLACEVRTGKTLMSLAAADKYGAKEVLLLTKKKAIASIQKDYEALQPGFNLYVTNYEAAHTLITAQFDLIILDEAHSLGQFPIIAERTKLVKKICEGKPVIYLSGTPSPESYSQLFHQLHCSSFSPFKEYKSFYAWARDYVDVKKRYYYNREVNDYKHAKQAEIESKIKHLFITYTQAEAGFSQMVNEHVLKVKMKESTYWLASKLRARRVHIGKNGEEVIADTEVKLLQKLHQIYSGTVLAEDGQMICFDDSKAKFIRAHFEGKKIAIFYKFRAELELIRWEFRGQITESPEEFNHRHDLTFVSQIISGREGINLSSADALVFYNIDFSHLSYWQARARMQTKERQTACELYWVFSEDGIEPLIYERVKAKQDYVLNYFRDDFKISNKKAA